MLWFICALKLSSRMVSVKHTFDLCKFSSVSVCKKVNGCRSPFVEAKSLESLHPIFAFLDVQSFRSMHLNLSFGCKHVAYVDAYHNTTIYMNEAPI